MRLCILQNDREGERTGGGTDERIYVSRAALPTHSNACLCASTRSSLRLRAAISTKYRCVQGTIRQEGVKMCKVTGRFGNAGSKPGVFLACLPKILRIFRNEGI